MCRRMMYVVVVMMLGLAPMNLVYGGFNPGSPDLLAWWTCDEGAGTVVGDTSGNGHDGTFVNGDPAWVAGIHGNAVELVGPTLVEVPSLNVELTEATMAGWIKPYGAQSDWSSIIMHREPSLAHGFNILGFQLAYHWNDMRDSWSYRGGDMIAEDDWTFAAVTIEPDKATFYVNGVAGSVNAISHGPATWDGNIYLGGDSRADRTDRRMNGALDDVSFFSRVLTVDEILAAMEGIEEAGATITVAAGGDIAAANATAVAGDTIDIAAGT
ncbi:MAG: LamG domain-containing protein, partial [Planctomycetota bacterium]